MNPIADMVRQMLAAGINHEMIVVAVNAAEQAAMSARPPVNVPTDEAAARRRAADRERKRLLREADKSGSSAEICGHDGTTISAESPQTSAESPQTSNPPLTLTSSIQEEGKKEKKVRARKAPSAELPQDWEPKPAHFEAAAKKGIPREAVTDKAEDMRIWARSGGVLKVDWDATFHGFIRRDAEKLALSRPRQIGNVHAQPRSLSAVAWEAAERANALAAGHSLWNDDGGPPRRLLPERTGT